MDRLCNRFSSIVRLVEYSEKNTIPFRIWLEFENETIGAKIREQYAGLIRICNINTRWTPLYKIKKPINTKMSSRMMIVHRKQFPVLCAEAITIHKSQGYKHEKVIVTSKLRVFSSLLYVALSRAKTSFGLYIVEDVFKVLIPKI